MQVLEPQFSYAQERFEMRQLPAVSAEVQETQERGLEILSACDGVEIDTTSRLARIAIKTPAYRTNRDTETYDELAQRTTTLLEGIYEFGRYDDPTVDPVIGLEWLGKKEIEVNISASLQIWLQQAGTLNTVQRGEVIYALRDPFFGVLKRSTHSVADERPMIQADYRRVHAVNQEPGKSTKRLGTDTWTVPKLQTLGHKTCAVAGEEDLSRIEIPANSNALYRLQGENIESPLQTLSLLFGLGALARLAAKTGPYTTTSAGRLFSWTDSLSI